MTSMLTIQRGEVIREMCARVLTIFADSVQPDMRGEEYSIDFGPAIVATLQAGAGPPQAPESRAFAVWLRQLKYGCGYPGLFGWGLAGYLLGLRTAATVWPAATAFMQRARRELAQYPPKWSTDNLAWFDYDLVTGPAGTLLVLAADPACTAEDLAGPVTHLIGLCERDDLSGLRVGHYRDEPMRGWNHGHINTGMAHGVTGVTAALRAAAEATGLTDALAGALKRCASWLVATSYTDARGLRTWPHRGDGGRALPRPQAWCYGTPSVAWTLWETGRTLGDQNLQAFAFDSAASFVAAYDDEVYRPDLAICHGLAGLALLWDAFDRHTGLAGAASLRDHFVSGLLERFDEVLQLANVDTTLLSGATGICAALLTLQTGNRAWLPALGLR